MTSPQPNLPLELRPDHPEPAHPSHKTLIWETLVSVGVFAVGAVLGAAQSITADEELAAVVAHDPGERVTLKFSDGTSVSARLMPGQPGNNKLCVHVVRFKE